MHHAEIGHMYIHMRGYVYYIYVYIYIYIYIYIYVYIYVCVYIGVCLPSYLLAVNSWHDFIIPPPLTSRSDDKGTYHWSAHGRPTW